MKKITSIILYVLLAISVLSLIPTFLYGKDGIDYMLYWTYILLGLAVGIAIVMSAINVGKNPQGGKRALIGVGALAVVLVVSYLLSSTEPVVYGGGKKVYEDTLGLIISDMQLYTAYIALGVTVLVIILGEIRNSFK